jgi:hypothetical protein
MKSFITFLTLIIVWSSTAQSVLNSGKWHRIGVKEAGVYKLNRDLLVRQIGIDASFDPKTIKVFGTVPGMLPQPNAIYRPNDPVEMPIMAVGENDGKFDNEDYFLFYSEGPDNFSFDEDGNPLHENNVYADEIYYFITTGGETGKRISSEATQPLQGSPATNYLDYISHEEDLENQLRSGRQWVGESFRRSQNKQRSFNYSMSGMLGEVVCNLRLASNSEEECSMDVSINGNAIGNIVMDPVPRDVYNEKIKYGTGAFQTSISGNEVTLTLNFNAASGVDTSIGYLDYFTLAILRSLSLVEENQHIIRMAATSPSSFEISNWETNAHIWSLADPLNPKEVIPQMNGNKASFTLPNSSKLAIVYKGNDFPTPDFFGDIPNQNIKALSINDGIIVTHKDFLTQAKRLAQFHNSHSGLSVDVVTTDQVYNEFSAGRQDITAIRDFLRYCYLNGSLKYATLFGDASYDYKDRLAVNTNYVPVYESIESAHNIYSHSSDDYFGFFEEDEGEWFEGVRRVNSTEYIIPYIDHTMEIGVGRLPAKSTQEAADIVDKIIRYKTAPQAYGKWRNQLAYFSDDGDNETHMKHAEAFFKIVDTLAIEYSAKKLYLDIYDQDKPETAIAAMNNTIKDGVFMFNYMGHGNESQLTQENIISLSVIREFTNRHKLPLFITATCEFGKYDSPIVVSGAERLLLNPNGGAIALLTTTRPVYANTNFPLNQALHENLFKKVNGKYPRLGDVIKLTKNASLNGPINRNFALLGDPMLSLNYPEFEIVFDQLAASMDTLSALENYKISGKVVDNGKLLSDFNGDAVITLWDIPQNKVTLGQSNDPFTYEDQTNLLFRGNVSVTDGFFESHFVLPKNTSYKYKSGKLTMYAWNENAGIDASGASRNFVLGGTASSAIDNAPPNATLYLNDESFRPGGTVGTSSLLIIQLSDESGINISNNGFSQGLTLQLNDEEPLNINEYYTANKNTYQKGTVLFPLQNLEPGNYTATVKVADAHNNAADFIVEFKVSEKPIIRLYNVVNYPNPAPASGATTFKFEHDREDEGLEVKLSVYNMEGRVVRTINYQIDSSPRVVDYLNINLSNDQGAPLHKGTYLYRIQVKSTLDDATNEVTKRLIIIN